MTSTRAERAHKRLQFGEPAIGSHVRQLLLPAFMFKGWVQPIAPYLCGTDLVHTQPVGTSLTPVAARLPGQAGSGCVRQISCLRLGRTRQGVMAQITPAAGKVQVLVASWTCPFGKHWGRISRRKSVTLQTYHGLLFLGYTTPNLAGGSSSFLHS